MKIDFVFKTYFRRRRLNQLPSRKLRVWQEVSNHMANVPAKAPILSWPKKWAVAPLLIMFILTSAGLGLAQTAEVSLPGSSLYAVKTTLQDWQVKLAPNQASKEKIHLQIIEQRSQELAKLKREAVTDPTPSPDQQQKIAEAEAKLGQAVISLIVSQHSNDSVAPVTKPDTTAVSNEAQSTDTEVAATDPVALLKTADAAQVGKAATDILVSTQLETKDKIAKIEEIILKDQTKPVDSTTTASSPEENLSDQTIPEEELESPDSNPASQPATNP